MVGVPGRSKGCHMCRKRKIACSLERPECYMCQSTGRKCPGYERQRIFIIQTSAKPQHEIKRSKVQQSEANKDVSKTTEPKQSNLQARNHTFMSLRVVNPDSLAGVACKRQVLDLFFAGYYVTSRYDSYAAGEWLSLIPHMTNLSPAFEASALALSTAKFGRRVNDLSLTKHSLSLYTRGLNELQKALWDPKLMYDDQTLGTCILLAMYEVFECPDQSARGYQNHHDGCARLIQARGPSAHISGLGHAIFISFRFIGALQALVTKSTFLSEPMWKTIPFCETNKGIVDALIDLLLESPKIMAKADELPKLQSPSLQLWSAMDLLKSCRELEIRFRQFYNELESMASSPMYWEISTSSGDSIFLEPPLTKIVPVRYYFVELRVAWILMLYWAMMTMLLSGITRLHYLVVQLRTVTCLPQESPRSDSTIEQQDPSMDPYNLPPLGQSDDFRSMGCNVLRSVQFCLDNRTNEHGLSAAVAPLNMVRDILKDWPGCELEVQCAEIILEHIRKQGVEIVQHLGTKV